MNISGKRQQGPRRLRLDSVIRRSAVVFAMTVAFLVPVAPTGAQAVPGEDRIVGGIPATSVADFPHIARLTISDG